MTAFGHMPWRPLLDMGTDSIDEMDPDEFQKVIQSHEREA